VLITLTSIVVLSWVAVAQATMQLQLSEPSAMLFVGIDLVGVGISEKESGSGLSKAEGKKVLQTQGD
jgi:hypothetical protein